MYHSYHTNVNVLFLIFAQFQSIKVPLRCCFIVCSVQEEIQKKLILTSHDEFCSFGHLNHRITQINHYSKHHLTSDLKGNLPPRTCEFTRRCKRRHVLARVFQKRFVATKLSTALPLINARS